jgi:pimeloyl-ACP methyl ester carboxylesterase
VHYLDLSIEGQPLRMAYMDVAPTAARNCPVLGREALKDLPDGKLVEIADSGHVSHIEKPDEFDAALTAFLKMRFC